VYPGYVPFDDKTKQPKWWDDTSISSSWGEVIGVHENRAGEREGAFAVTSFGLVVFGRDSLRWLPYYDMTSWDRLIKEPVSRSLTVHTSAGDRVELLFERGGAFAFVQFLSGAKRRSARRPDHS
jgi:hypothetical protein